MRASKRRKLDVVLLGAGAAATGAAALIGGLAGDTERVAGMWVGSALSADGSAAVTEVIDYDFGVQERHGIFRTIPGVSLEDPVSVASASAPDRIEERSSASIGGEPGVKLRIGDPDVTITGQHRYRIDYRHRGLLDAAGTLRWDAVGTAWEVPVEQTEVHVVAPWSFAEPTCSKGSTGASGGCELTQPEPGHLVATVGRLGTGEGITVTARRGAPLAASPELPAPPLEAPPDPGAGLALPAATATAVGLGAVAVTSRLVRRAGRERVGVGGVADAAWAAEGGPSSEVLLDHEDLASMATTEYAPPEGLTPAMGGIILAESVQPEHKVAWLIEAAIAGAVKLDEMGTIVRLSRRPGTGPAEIQGPLDRMFGGRGAIHLGTYDPTFAKGWEEVGVQLTDWKKRSGLWDPAGDRKQLWIRLLGGLAAVVGALGVVGSAAMAARHGEGWLPAIAVTAAIAAAGFAALLRGWELKVRTPQGSGLWLRVESFRRFLAGSEAYHAEEAAKRGLLREYTAWAVAVGEIDRWERAVQASSITDQAGLGYVHMAPVLMAGTSKASTAPSSSGGGGGGSVGGGGGGGGGGSW
jgi:hypothetical protein